MHIRREEQVESKATLVSRTDPCVSLSCYTGWPLLPAHLLVSVLQLRFICFTVYVKKWPPQTMHACSELTVLSVTVSQLPCPQMENLARVGSSINLWSRKLWPAQWDHFPCYSFSRPRPPKDGPLGKRASHWQTVLVDGCNRYCKGLQLNPCIQKDKDASKILSCTQTIWLMLISQCGIAMAYERVWQHLEACFKSPVTITRISLYICHFCNIQNVRSQNYNLGIRASILGREESWVGK